VANIELSSLVKKRFLSVKTKLAKINAYQLSKLANNRPINDWLTLVIRLLGVDRKPLLSLLKKLEVILNFSDKYRS